MIPSLVDTSLDFGSFRVVRPYVEIEFSLIILFRPGMMLEGVLNNIVFELGNYIENCCPRSPLNNY